MLPGQHLWAIKQFTSDPCTYSTTALKQKEIKNGDAAIYPNPTSGHFFINFHEATSEREIKVVNILGQEIYFTKNENEIDISQVKTGIYFLKVLEKGELVVLKKIAKE